APALPSVPFPALPRSAASVSTHLGWPGPAPVPRPRSGRAGSPLSAGRRAAAPHDPRSRGGRYPAIPLGSLIPLSIDGWLCLVVAWDASHRRAGREVLARRRALDRLTRRRPVNDPAIPERLAAIERNHPGWHTWIGVGGLLYARRPRTSPPIVVRDAT